jgi:hypothetical protein
MTYTKPNIVALGAAVQLIESVIRKGFPGVIDFRGRFALTPAYDLDE